MPTPRCGDLLLVKGYTQPLSSDLKIKVEINNEPVPIVPILELVHFTVNPCESDDIESV
jgi:hypothetical protein